MKKVIVLFAIIYSCNNPKFREEFYPDGSLKLKVEIGKNNLPNGLYEEYYESGELKTKGYYSDGLPKDTFQTYYKDGKLKEKGVLDEKLFFKKGWWSYYDDMGNIQYRDEYTIVNDSVYLNQMVYYNVNGTINYSRSSYFNLDLSDTISLGWNAGKLEYHSNLENSYKKLLQVIVLNEYSEKEIKSDTFNINKETPYFGIFAHKVGIKKIKGTVLETLFYVEDIGKDSARGKVVNHKKYFEREVYVKDSID